MQVGDQVRIKGAGDTVVIIWEADGKFRVRCDCGMEWSYGESALENFPQTVD